MTYRSSECSHRTSGAIIGVPLLTGYCTGGYKFANCGCSPSSNKLIHKNIILLNCTKL